MQSTESETTLNALKTRVDSWVRDNPEAIAGTAERARKAAENVLKESKPKLRHLHQRVTI